MAEAAWINEDAGAPAYNAPELRRLQSVHLYSGTDRFGARQGVRPHSTAVVTVSGTTWTQHDVTAVVYPGLADNDGPYVVEKEEEAGSLNPADGALARIDALDLQVRDDDEDASGFRDVRVVYVAGTPAGSPSAPAATANSLRLATILVPAGGAPSPSVASLAAYTVSAGGILPVRTTETLPTAGLAEGTYADQGGGLWRWSGSAWAAAASPNSPTTVVFTSSGSFTKATYPWGHRVVVEVVGGGGGGGGAATTGAGAASTGSGGGGGGYARESIAFSALATSETVTVGAAGSGGSAGDNDGTSGGTSSFGSHCSATGGANGEGSAGSGISNYNAGGLGGSGSGGDLNVSGGDGGNGCRANGEVLTQGWGGDSFFGGITRASASTQGGNGVSGNGYGGGGSGGHNRESQGTARSGGAGAAGVVIVTVY